MAITKILNIREAKGRNPATHLETALNYIQNPDKTEKCVLVGSINCLPDTAFQQMVETKELYQKTDKRQGYHVIISFSPEEKVTAEQAMYVLEHFAKDVLGDNYEAVYAVHTDRDHMHGHLIWNSVSITTGEKYNSPKGNWKNHLQPVTNKYCRKLGLEIMPAEYSKNPKNLSRDLWEKEMEYKEIILRDAKMCAYAAGDVEHFKYLMRSLGYIFKAGVWMEVQAPGCRYYHKLKRLDEMFAEDKLKYYVDFPYTVQAYFYSKDIRKIRHSNMSAFQERYYAKMYRLRIVEQKRFSVKGVKFTEELKRFYQLQDEYLMLVNHDIRSITDLLNYRSSKEEKIQQIENRQQELYRLNSSKKRRIKTEEHLREYQQWHLGVQNELDNLKQQKKDAKYQLKLADATLNEKLDMAMLEVSEAEPLVSNDEIVIPIPVVEADEQEIPNRGKLGVRAIINYNFDDLVEKNLKRLRVKYHSIYGEGMIPDTDELGIYHVHGFLPQEKENYENLTKSLLVFSEEGYHKLMLEPYNWANISQLNYMINNTCFFIGLSMTDEILSWFQTGTHSIRLTKQCPLR